MRKKFSRIVDQIHVDKIDIRDIYDKAIRNALGNGIELPEHIVYRWMVNTVRHEYSNYENGLDRIHRLKRHEIEYNMYKNAVLTKIGMIYPNLNDECNKQKRSINMVRKA